MESCCYSALCEPMNLRRYCSPWKHEWVGRAYLCTFTETIEVGVCAEHTPGSEVQGRAWEAGEEENIIIIPNILQIVIH